MSEKHVSSRPHSALGILVWVLLKVHLTTSAFQGSPWWAKSTCLTPLSSLAERQQNCTADGWPGGHHTASLFMTQCLHGLPLVQS